MGQTAGWAQGNWNSLRRRSDSTDMVTAFADGGYEEDRHPDAVAVPEPGRWSLSTLGLAPRLTVRRTHG